jgi:hypothetical protein
VYREKGFVFAAFVNGMNVVSYAGIWYNTAIEKKPRHDVPPSAGSMTEWSHSMITDYTTTQDKHCPTCGAPHDKKGSYCCNACRQQAYRSRKNIQHNPYNLHDDFERSGIIIDAWEMPLLQDDEECPVTEEGYIYILKDQSTEGVYKIGSTKNLKRREIEHKRNSSFDVDIIHAIKSEDCRVTEKRLHQMFRTKKKYGEWFRLTPQDIDWLKTIREM